MISKKSPVIYVFGLLAVCDAHFGQQVDELSDSVASVYLPPFETPQPVETKVTVLLMNWKRPANLRKIVEAYQAYDEVLEIVLMVRCLSCCVNLDIARFKIDCCCFRAA